MLLGEVHDNPEGHRLRLDVLRRAVADGWRPAIVMEQFDIERQADIERARRERPRDAQHVVDAAGGGPRSTWHWPFYLPIIELALEHDLPLVAGNLSRADAGRVVREGYAQALGASRVAALGLDGPLAAGLQAAQEREVDVGHCGALPPSMLLPMARAQFARDAVMADALRSNAAGGTVLIAGNGHARRDLGVPRWLGPALQHRELAVGFLEGEAPSPDAYDVVVEVPALPRTDPCLGLQGSVPPAGDGTGATGGQSGR